MAILITCRRCRTGKPLDDFGYRASAKFNRNTECKQCVADRKTASRAVLYAQGLTQKGTPRIERKKSEPVSRKVSNLCQDCGITFETHRSDRRDRCPKCQKVISTQKRLETLTARRGGLPPKKQQAPEVRTITCGHCAVTYQESGAGRTKYCSKSCAREFALTKYGCRNRSCKRCGTSLGEISLKTYCDSCRRTLQKARDKASRKPWDKNHRSRARHYGVPHESISRREVCEADGWICGICTQPIDPDAKYPDLMSPSLDHIVPLARGGGHLRGNVQAAHFLCNSLKSDAMPEAADSLAEALI